MIEIEQSVKDKIIDNIITHEGVQRLTILPNDELRIVITIPYKVFEWFIDVFDSHGKKVHSNWIDHYGETGTNLESEMKESVEKFIRAVTTCRLRLIPASTPGQSILEVYADERWTAVLY
jgi:hypothetical protein